MTCPQRPARQLGADGRVLVRPSGTEPAIRLMVQAGDAGLAERVIGELAAEVRLALAEGDPGAVQVVGAGRSALPGPARGIQC